MRWSEPAPPGLVTLDLPVRRRWHPLTVAVGLCLAVAGAVAGAAGHLTGGPVPGPLVAGLTWLLLGACAGYATSGST